LRWTGDGRLQLRSPPEVRSFVAARSASDETVSRSVRHLAAVREQRGQAPPRMISVLSYALGEVLDDGTVKAAQRQAQLKRQILLHHTDVMCLFGLDPESTGAGLVTTLVEEGYSYAWARSATGEANAIFWDRGRVALVSNHECGAALAVDVCMLEDQTGVVRVICMRPEVPTTTSAGPVQLFAGRPSGGPLIACVDFTLLGGADSAAIVEELAGMTSLHRKILGSEILVPVCQRDPTDGSSFPARAPASGLIRLHSPDSIIYEGLSPLLTLSGHSEHYLVSMTSEDCVQQFPAFRMPLVAAFQLSAHETVTEGNSAEPSQCIGIAG